MNVEAMFRPLLEQLAELTPLIAMLAKITIVLAFAWVGHTLLLRANPRWRVLIWRATFVSLLLIPVFHLITPPVRFQGQTSSITAEVEKDIEAGWTSGGSRAIDGTSKDTSAPTTDAFFDHEPSGSYIETSWIPSWQLLLALTWSVGFTCCLLRLSIGLIRIRALVNRSEPVPESLQTEFSRIATNLTVKRKAALRVSTEITAPVLCGMLPPTVLIPSRMTQPTCADQRPGVFAHELAHVRAEDLLWNLFLHSVSALLWFHPLVWYTRGVHASACESVSDAVAASYLGDVQEYGRTLARVALDAARPPMLSLGMAHATDIEQRVRALERSLFARELSWHFAFAAVVSCLVLTGSIGGLKVIRAEIAEESLKTGTNTQSKDKDKKPDSSTKESKETTKTNVEDSSWITDEAEVAVKKGLAFLASRQRRDGSFGGKKELQTDPTMTALCGMAFIASGSKPGEGPYGEVLNKAVDYLLKQVQVNGFIGLKESPGSMYNHAYALRFLAEVQTASKTKENEVAIAKAVDLIVKSQNELDGWRYSPMSKDADSSITSCQVIALQAARRAGSEVPQETIDRAIKYLQSCQNVDGGYAYVAPDTGSALPRSSAVMAALYLSGVDAADTEKGLAYLNTKATPPNSTEPYFFFTQFHLCTALRHAGDEHFRKWYEPSRDQLLKLQADDGSWTLEHYPPEYATAKACIVLLSPRKK